MTSCNQEINKLRVCKTHKDRRDLEIISYSNINSLNKIPIIENDWLKAAHIALFQDLLTYIKVQLQLF